MLHIKWLALHHCLWEWSSGEALGSLGQPLWFVLMFWFHNPNILRAVICSLFPFYSVILLLFFFFFSQPGRAVNRGEEKQFWVGVRKEMEEERAGKKRAGWRERMESKQKRKKKNQTRLTKFQVCKLQVLWDKYVTCCLFACMFPYMCDGCVGTLAKKRNQGIPGKLTYSWPLNEQRIRRQSEVCEGHQWGVGHHMVSILQLIITAGSGSRLLKWLV